MVTTIRLRFTLGEYRICALAVLILLLSGCSSKIRVKSDRIEHSDSFTHASLAAGGMAVFAVTSAYGEEFLHADIEKQMAATLEDRLFEIRGDFEIITSETVEKQLGGVAFDTVLIGYRDAGQVDPTQLGAIAELVPDTRYMVFARIEKYVRETNTNVKMTVAFDVYDLYTGQLVWFGVLRTAEDVTERDYILTDRDVQITYGDEPTFFWQMLEAIFDKFAESLPD